MIKQKNMANVQQHTLIDLEKDFLVLTVILQNYIDICKSSCRFFHFIPIFFPSFTSKTGVRFTVVQLNSITDDKSRLFSE